MKDIYKIAFLTSGYGSIAETLIQAIEKNIIPCAQAVCVISDRQSKSLELGNKYSVACHHVDFHSAGSREAFSDKILELFLKYEIDFAFSTFDRLVSGKLIDVYKNKLINLHPSLTPAFRGIDPLRKSVEYGCKIIGATCHFIDESIDGGPIINQCILAISPESDFDMIEHALFPLRQAIALESVYAMVKNLVTIDGRIVRMRNADYASLPINPKIKDFNLPPGNVFNLKHPKRN